MKKAIALLGAAVLLQACGPRSTVHPVDRSRPSASTPSHHRGGNVRSSVSTVPMRRDNGVCYVMVRINDVDMEVIFDTGASDVVISAVESMFLIKQGKLTKDDILGSEYYQVADGSIASGTVINLKSVQIGNKKLNNVRATVVDNMEAPLLLGQSALSRLSSVVIDYNSNTIQFE